MAFAMLTRGPHLLKNCTVLLELPAIHTSASHTLIKLTCVVQSVVHFQLLSPTALLTHPAVVNPPQMGIETVWKVACNCVWHQSYYVFSCHVGYCQQHLLLAVEHNQSDCQLCVTLLRLRCCKVAPPC